MAGHSKWANIKFKKASQDKKRGKLFTKLIREITVAAKESGGDPAHNPRLRGAIDKALTQNMTRDNIDRAIKRGVGGEEQERLEEIRYEGYGPGGVAVLVCCLTDSRNRTVGDVRHCLTKHGGNLGTDGSVSYLFKYIGQIILAPNDKLSEDLLLEWLLEVDVQDILSYEDGSFEIQTEPTQVALERVVSVLTEKNIPIASQELTYIAENLIPLEAKVAETYEKMLEKLEDLDDVQAVYTNAELPDSD